MCLFKSYYSAMFVVWKCHMRYINTELNLMLYFCYMHNDINSDIQKQIKELYDQDYIEWVDKNIELLKNKEYDSVDWENLLEEIQDMGKQVTREAISYLSVILEHLYKLDNFRQEEKVGKGWIKSILNSRNELLDLFEDNPSLEKKLPEQLDKAWKKAVRKLEVWLFENDRISEVSNIPKECPYTYEEVMDRILKLVR